MSLPNHIAYEKRGATSCRWHRAKAQQRMARGVDADTMRRRALHDARGQIVREGATYSASGVTHWRVRRAVAGRVDQFEFVANGRIRLCAGPRRFPRAFKP